MRLPWRRSQQGTTGFPRSIDEWISFFGFAGVDYPFGLQRSSVFGNKQELGRDFAGLVDGGYKRNGIVFACELVRLHHFSEATFKFRRLTNGRPGNLFGSAELAILEEPWPGGTTGDLLMQMLLHADFGGSAYVARLSSTRLAVLRPDWTTIVLRSRLDGPDLATVAADSEVFGYIYEPPGAEPTAFLAENVAQFTPVPDPTYRFAGTSWLHAVVTDVKGDKAATQHKLSFFENGGIANYIVTFDTADHSEFDKLVKNWRAGHDGARNAYKTLFKMPGTTVDKLGSDFQQMDFRQTVGVSETRIAAAAGTPPVIVGLSEGLQGSSLNAGNYNSARRRFADGTMRPLWRNAAGSLARVVNVPQGAQLWYDDRDIAFLREDMKERAEVLQAKSAAARQLFDAGFTPESIVAAIEAEDLTLLQHSGAISIQLQSPAAAPIGGD